MSESDCKPGTDNKTESGKQLNPSANHETLFLDSTDTNQYGNKQGMLGLTGEEGFCFVYNYFRTLILVEILESIENLTQENNFKNYEFEELRKVS